MLFFLIISYINKNKEKVAYLKQISLEQLQSELMENIEKLKVL